MFYELDNLIEYTAYLDEYFMGKVAPVATTKGGNNSHHAMAWGCMQRYRALFVNVGSVMHGCLGVAVLGQPTYPNAHAHATPALNREKKSCIPRLGT